MSARITRKHCHSFMNLFYFRALQVSSEHSPREPFLTMARGYSFINYNLYIREAAGCAYPSS